LKDEDEEDEEEEGDSPNPASMLCKLFDGLNIFDEEDEDEDEDEEDEDEDLGRIPARSRAS
jgi:hypothetical protein